MNKELKENKKIEFLKELVERIKQDKKIILEICRVDCDAEEATGLTIKGLHLDFLEEKSQELLKDFSDNALKAEISRREKVSKDLWNSNTTF